MEPLLTPKYTHEKLDNPSDVDLIDVFEDVWQTFMFSQVEKLLEHPHGDSAAMSLLTAYFEAAWIYFTGESSRRRSEQYFVHGFLHAFQPTATSAGGVHVEIVAKAIYKHIRCGLAHTGMVSFKVNYSRAGANAFFVTYPKSSDGSLNLLAPVSSIVVNPLRMLEGAKLHFQRYVATLRAGNDQVVLAAFRKAAISLWGIGEGDNIIGLTEEAYLDLH